MAEAYVPFRTSGSVFGSGITSPGIRTGFGAPDGRAPKSFDGSCSSNSPSGGASSRNPYGSGQASMQSPQALQLSRWSSTGMSPVSGLISDPSVMQCFAQASMQRPHPLQYWGRRTGLARSFD